MQLPWLTSELKASVQHNFSVTPKISKKTSCEQEARLRQLPSIPSIGSGLLSTLSLSFIIWISVCVFFFLFIHEENGVFSNSL